MAHGPNPNMILISHLQNELSDVFKYLIDANHEIAILDFPNYSNVGDSAIYLGVLELLRVCFNRAPSYVSEMNFQGLSSNFYGEHRNVVLLHGGGNFGDIWPAHQNFRERVLRELRDFKIIQMPQTIWFKDKQNLERTRRLIADHPDFTLLVRDAVSFEMAQSFACETYLCPDSAFMLGSIQPVQPPTSKLLLLLRSDRESRVALEGSRAPDETRIEDWLSESGVTSVRDRLAGRLDNALPGGGRFRMRMRMARFEKWARARVERGIRQLSSAEFIITDRLHGHILSLLLGKDHAIIDNNYGKVGSFVQHWTSQGGFMVEDNLEKAIYSLETTSDRDSVMKD